MTKNAAQHRDASNGDVLEAEKLYVYAVVPAGEYRPTSVGIDSSPLHAVGRPEGPRAVVHTHRAGPYDGPDEDVKRWILQHSEVIEDAWQGAGSVLPVSFNVIVRADVETGATAEVQLEEWLEGESASLLKRLEDLDGTSELRVEVSLDRGLYLEDHAEIRSIRAEMADRPAGVRRLLEKRLEKTEKEIADQAADELYPTIRARIARQCLEIEEYRTPSSESDRTPILTTACLVTTPGIQGLGAELTAIQNELPAAAIRFLGPWPPYSFSDMSTNEQLLQGKQAKL